jgi:hypothetical protein
MKYPLLIQNTENQAKKEFFNYLKNDNNKIFSTLSIEGALLFRGFDLSGVEDFGLAVQALSSESKKYIGGDSPRTKISGNIYTSTEYPANQTISMHHEKSFSNIYPNNIYFFCDIEPSVGGQTPIADGHQIYQQMPKEIIDKFSQKKLKYIMNLHDGKGFGKSWQEVFETTSKQDLEEFLNKNNISYSWKTNGLLSIYEIVDPILTHPINGKKVFFSQADQWHPSNLDKDLFESMKEIIAVEDFYHNCTFGDGTEIKVSDLELVREIVNKNRVFFDWRKGDLLVLDNLITMHGRAPFSGTRRILVAMS